MISTQTIYLAGGCFWGVEELFRRIRGVSETTVGYANGRVPEAAEGDATAVTYERVCQGDTGYRETVRVRFDPRVVTTNELLWAYFGIVDPTVANAQGHDVGTQYQAGIYWDADDAELAASIRAYVQGERERVEGAGHAFCVESHELLSFVPAEEYHQRYLVKNPGGYCHVSPMAMRDILDKLA